MRLIPDTENLIVEFKSDRKKYPDHDLVESVVGMANTEGGEIFLGVEDDGTITGVHQAHRDPVGLTVLIANRTVPPITVLAEILQIEARHVMCIRVPKSRTIVSTADGKVLRRRIKFDGSPENAPLYPIEISTRLSSLGAFDFSEMCLPDSTMKDLDPSEISRLKEILATGKGDRNLQGLAEDELLKALKLIKEQDGVITPTVAGLLILGREGRISKLIPTARINFQVLEGTGVRVNETYAKPLLTAFELIERHFDAWNPEYELSSGLYRISVPSFSKTAFREALVNAFCHRDYAILQDIRIAIDDSGLTISSPGGFIDGVHLRNLITVEPRGRNQALADALKRIGLAERTGRGIDRIFESSILYGKMLPDYSESGASYVKMFLPRDRGDIRFIRLLEEQYRKNRDRLSIFSLLVLSHLREKSMSLGELNTTIPISDIRLKQIVRDLIERGMVVKSSRGMYALNLLENQERLQTFEKDNAEKTILTFVQKNGTISREEAANLLDINPNRAYRLLKGMAEKGYLTLIGSGRSSKYIKS